MGRDPQGNTKRGPKSKRGDVQYSFADYEATQLLLEMVVGMSYKGGALRVGLTRDGGALAVGIYDGDEYGTEYIRPNEDMLIALREISAAWEIPLAVWDDEAGRWLKA